MKLNIFTLTKYRNIIYVNVDGLVTKNLNLLLLLATPRAMPRVHWLDQPFFSAMQPI